MAGHSKWKQIKHKKEISDKKRAAIFSKFSKLITISARDNPDINSNIQLQAVVSRAKEANMPKDNIERAITKAKDKDAINLKEIYISAIGPSNSAFIVKAITDNSNRTIQDFKQLFTKNNLKMVADGSLDWMFEKNKDTTLAPLYPITLSANEHSEFIKIIEELEENDDFEDIYFNFALEENEEN